ncbi:C45 family autoproteolytic acyltransferase/hydolase [Neobacillus muris]|uniref:C45 family autoproteolytic acyltransferase/hydolase n=1 Tax=Neobacillus muris TaxID=2941334 RepID=UPI00203ED8EF|nr:C45 family peptidase [Neobacillus muris]
MKKIFADIIQFRGTHYDFGFMQGELLKDSILVKNREQQWKVRKPLFRIDIEETKHVFKKLAPFIWEEFLGLQDAMKWPMERVLLEFGGYRTNIHPSGCSIYVGEDYLIRNYDYHPKTYDGRFTVFQPADGGYAIMGPCQKVTGRMDGLNEKGLTMGYTFMNRKRPGDGFVCNMIGRLALELCATAEEAVDLLKEIPHRHSFSYIFFDKKCQAPYIVETSPRRVEVRQGYSCTNHFHIMTEENRHNLDDSLQRQEMMEKNRIHDLKASEAFRLLNNTGQGVFSKLYGSWAGTIHTSAYFPKGMKVWFVLGGDQEPIEFHFSEWLKGKDLVIDRIEGEVDTDIPFVNMEKADWYRS